MGLSPLVVAVDLPTFGIGTTSATFQTVGNVPYRRLAWYSAVTALASAVGTFFFGSPGSSSYQASLTISVVMPSSPGPWSWPRSRRQTLPAPRLQCSTELSAGPRGAAYSSSVRSRPYRGATSSL